jgi:hypothetical protein
MHSWLISIIGIFAILNGCQDTVSLYSFFWQESPRNCHKFPPQPGSLIDNLETCQKKVYREPEFVNLFLRSPGIDSQPGGPVVRKPYLTNRPARLYGLAKSIPGLLKRLQIRAQETLRHTTAK